MIMKIHGKNNRGIYPVLLLSFLLLSSYYFEQRDGVKENTLSREEKEEGWKLLFDGKNLKGWRGIGRETVPENRWIAEAGTIRNLGSGEVQSLADGQPEEGGDLMTAWTFEDFELYFKWKIGKGGNTGLKYNVSKEYFG